MKCSFVVNAESGIPDDNISPEFDEKGRVVSGSVMRFDDVDHYIRYYYLYPDYGIYYGVFNPNKDEKFITVHCAGSDGKDVTFKYDQKLMYLPESGFYKNGDLSENFVAKTGKNVSQWYSSASIPVFDETDPDYSEKLNKYLNDGDYSGAVNSKDVDDSVEPEYSEDIELPKNFHAVQGYKINLFNKIFDAFTKDIVFNWQQTVDTSGYAYDVDYKIFVEGEKVNNVDSGGLFLKVDKTWENIATDYSVYVKDVPYSGSKNITLTIPYRTFNEYISKVQTDNGVYSNFNVKKLIVRVRNKADKKCSNYVMCTIDFESGTVTNSEVDDNDVTVDDAEYDHSDGTVDQDEGGININNLNDVSNIVSYIRSGFGLFGNNGLMAFFKSFFNGIVPQSYWNLILTGMAVIIFVGIINFILKR